MCVCRSTTQVVHSGRSVEEALSLQASRGHLPGGVPAHSCLVNPTPQPLADLVCLRFSLNYQSTIKF